MFLSIDSQINFLLVSKQVLWLGPKWVEHAIGRVARGTIHFCATIFLVLFPLLSFYTAIPIWTRSRILTPEAWANARQIRGNPTGECPEMGPVCQIEILSHAAF